MAMKERDPHTGYLTTGHEWNGITELNTPVPRPIYVFLAAAVLFSVVYWLLMPAWPLGVTYTRGLLGIDQRTTVRAALDEAALDRSRWIKRVETETFDSIRADTQLMQAVRQTGATLFGDNCAPCHGRRATGGPGFPSLTTASSLWGGDAESMVETIGVGVNSDHPETRTSQMMAFGRDQILSRDDVEKVVGYVRSLSGSATAVPPEALAAGKAIFDDNCAACHGGDGHGNPAVGAPDLTDASWIYGGDLQSVFTTVWNGRQGHMPAWEGRLSTAERRILALYLAEMRPTPP